MKVEWFVAKYMADLRRREPINIGIVLRAGDNTTFRFLGQRSDGQIDGRRIKWAGSVRTYKAWVEYWRSVVDRGSAAFGELLKPVEDANYSIEPGGSRLLGGDDLDPDAFADTLFALLVAEESERTNLTVARLSEGILNRVGIVDEVKRDVFFRVPDTTDSVYFDYRYDNGAATLMQRVALMVEDERAWDATHAAAWSFAKASDYRLAGAEHNSIALVKARPDSPELRRQLGVLGDVATVIEVSNTERGATELSERLGLKPSTLR